jgi:WD40 repeat protein
VLFFFCCTSRDAIIEKQIEFTVEKKITSENENSPYFFGSILNVCANTNYLYVSDWKNYNIKIFDHDFNHIKTIGRKGNGPGEFGQIFTGMNCDEQRVYLLTINRLYVFSSEGIYENEITLRFMPRELFLFEDKFIFKLNSSEKVFCITDSKGKIIEKFYDNTLVNTKNCGKTYMTPGAFLSSDSKLFILGSMDYNITVYDLISKKTTFFTRDNVDFLEMNCEKNGDSYTLVGGHSWMLRNKAGLYYFYFDSKKKSMVDIFDNNRMKLRMVGNYSGDIHPKCGHPGNAKFIGVIPDEADTLYLCSIKEKQ